MDVFARLCATGVVLLFCALITYNSVDENSSVAQFIAGCIFVLLGMILVSVLAEIWS